MKLIAISPDTTEIGWPKVIGYARAGAISVLNLFGLKVIRIGGFWALTVG